MDKPLTQSWGRGSGPPLVLCLEEPRELGSFLGFRSRDGFHCFRHSRLHCGSGVG